jgi:ADP-heptose:LPS heptosyltransferase
MPNPRKKKKLFRTLVAHTLQLLVRKKTSSQQFTGQLNSVVILAQEKIGDSILLTPLLGNLRHHFPNLEIHLVCFSKASADFFSNDPHITAIHQAKKEFFNYFRHLLGRKFDLLFNTKDSPSTHFLLQTALISARIKVGHQHPDHEKLFNHLIQTEFHTRMALKNCALLSFLPIKYQENTFRPYLPPAPVSSAITSCTEKYSSGHLIGLNISAGASTRYWTEEKWSGLIGNFPDVQFIVFSAPGDIHIKQRLEQHGNVMATPPTENIYEVGLLVQHLRLLITPDTSLVHVASCYAIPVIGLYTAAFQDLSRFGPYLVDFEVITSSTSQVSDIEVKTVTSVVQKKLQQTIGNTTDRTIQSDNKKTEFN